VGKGEVVETSCSTKATANIDSYNPSSFEFKHNFLNIYDSQIKYFIEKFEITHCYEQLWFQVLKNVVSFMQLL